MDRGSETKKQLKMLVAGGRLQGTEITYLARKAGYQVTVVDHNEDVPAAGIAHRFLMGDVTDEDWIGPVLQETDYLIPAIENEVVLERLQKLCRVYDVKMIFDLPAYRISQSKSRTNELLADIGVRIPGNYPDCGFPVILKPDDQSGSQGVRKIESLKELVSLKIDPASHPVIQQYVTGLSYSLEVLGNGSDALYPMVTEVVTDEKYDCKRIVAPVKLPEKLEREFRDFAERINEALKIRGIFDIEVIEMEGKLYVLEIDARFPSQTPVSVYLASGMNFVEMLVELYEGTLKALPVPEGAWKAAVYQQILIEEDRVTVLGEHIMSDAGPLSLLEGFCGADAMMTDYRPGKRCWKAIVLLSGENLKDVEQKWCRCLEEISRIQGCSKIHVTEG